MVAELSALQQIINALTGLNGLWPVIVECIVTTIYTCTHIALLRGHLTINNFQHSEASVFPSSQTIFKLAWWLA